jgi:hypothetical protein
MRGWFCKVCERFNNVWHSECWYCDEPRTTEEIRKLNGSGK